MTHHRQFPSDMRLLRMPRRPGAGARRPGEPGENPPHEANLPTSSIGEAHRRSRTLDLRLERLRVGRMTSGPAAMMRQICDLSGAVVSTEGRARRR